MIQPSFVNLPRTPSELIEMRPMETEEDRSRECFNSGKSFIALDKNDFESFLFIFSLIKFSGLLADNLCSIYSQDELCVYLFYSF